MFESSDHVNQVLVTSAGITCSSIGQHDLTQEECARWLQTKPGKQWVGPTSYQFIPHGCVYNAGSGSGAGRVYFNTLKDPVLYVLTLMCDCAFLT